MLKVYIIDDEKLIVDELKKILDWGQYGYTVIGSSTDSRQAYAEIIKLKPHLVISDINMPEISGLYLFERIKEVNPLISFCFLSAYDNFDYVQEALQLGAVNYLKKPILVEELIALIQNISKNIDGAFSSQLFEAIVSRQYYEKDTYIENLFLNNDSIKPSSQYRIVTFRDFNEEKMEHCQKLTADYYRLYHDEKMAIFLAYYVDFGCLSSLSANYQVSVGVSKTFTDFSLISKHLRMSRIAAFQSFISGQKTLTIVEDNPHLADLIREINSTKNTYELQVLLSDLKAKIIAYEIKCYDLQTIYRTTMFNLVKFDVIPFDHKFDEISVVNHYEDLDEFVKEINSYFVTEEMIEENISVIDMVKDEIENNIAQHYSLSYFAHKYHYNLSYFSQFFKKQTGCSFAEYVANVKMNIAKTLIQNNDISLSQIADQVGYKDYYHFSKMFKKITGMTPSDYYKANRFKI